MFEKVNPSHPDKIADRIAGAIVDLAYEKQENPKIAVEVLIGHNVCNVIIEASVCFSDKEIEEIVFRIAGKMLVNVHSFWQDEILSQNQEGKTRCGDNGIFRGMPVTGEQLRLSMIVRGIYDDLPYDGKYILNDKKLIACQSNVNSTEFAHTLKEEWGEALGQIIVNPLGDWSGGTNVDTGATNRKLGSDMGDAVTGGGLHGKDLSKADVSVNIYAHIRAQQAGKAVELHCAIGDEYVDGLPYHAIVETARDYIKRIGGFEKFAEWGLI